MKISKYTKFLINDDKYYIYNSISNFLCKIDEELYFTLNQKDVEGEIEDKKTVDFLFENKILTNNDKDDLLDYISSIQLKRRQSSLLNLTLTPTMDCNFYCPYCFETKEKGVMSETIIDNIIEFIGANKNIDSVNLDWFGGEPLLAPQVIESLSEKIKKLNLRRINSTIITNGYFLNDENLTLLKRCGVTYIQLSMDGIFEAHNKKRFTKDDKDTFSTILKNIDNFFAKGYEIQLGIRMNIDGENINEYPKIHQFFKERYKNSKWISIHPAFIINTTKSDNSAAISNEDTKLNFNKVLVEEFKSPKFVYPNNGINECAVRNIHTWAIDAKGDVYKCWEIIGNNDYKVGELTEKGINVTNKTLLNRYLFASDPFENQKCLDCFCLPICGGGCPHKRIENEFNNKDFDHCSQFLNNLDDYLFERIKIYEKEK